MTQASGTNSIYLGLLALACLSGGATAQSTVKTRVVPATGTSIASSGRLTTGKNVPAAKPTAKNAKSVAAAHDLVTVTVRAEAQVAGKTFTLGEIADLKGGDLALRQRLAAVEVGAAPLPGLSRQILPGDVIVHLRAAKYGDLLESKRINLITPPLIQIGRAGQDVAAEQIIKAALAMALPVIKDMEGASLEPEALMGKITLPAGRIMLVPGACQGHAEQGALHVAVSLIVDDKTVQTVDVTLKVHRKLTALVARHVISPHDTLTADDLVLSMVDLPLGFTQPVADLKTAIGKRATRLIQAGMPVPADALEVPPDIVANARVNVTYAVGAVSITLPGLTRQPGHIGEMIRVFIPETGKELQGSVIDDHTVRITESDSTVN